MSYRDADESEETRSESVQTKPSDPSGFIVLALLGLLCASYGSSLLYTPPIGYMTFGGGVIFIALFGALLNTFSNKRK